MVHPDGTEALALVAVQPVEPSQRTAPLRRPDAAFLAHLIATKQREPQTRDLRRAQPGEAAHAYEVMMAVETRRDFLRMT